MQGGNFHSRKLPPKSGARGQKRKIRRLFLELIFFNFLVEEWVPCPPWGGAIEMNNDERDVGHRKMQAEKNANIDDDI